MNKRVTLALAGGLALAGLGLGAAGTSAMPIAGLNASVAQSAVPQGIQKARYICGYWECCWVPSPYHVSSADMSGFTAAPNSRCITAPVYRDIKAAKNGLDLNSPRRVNSAASAGATTSCGGRAASCPFVAPCAAHFTRADLNDFDRGRRNMSFPAPGPPQ